MRVMESDESNVCITVLSSDIKLELLRLFHTNPKLTCSSEQMTKQIGRTKDELQHELNDLVAIGVLKRIGGLESFCLDEDKDGEIQAEIFRYLLRGEDYSKLRYAKRLYAASRRKRQGYSN